MIRTMLLTLLIAAIPVSASAQLSDLLRRVDPTKARKAVEVARAATGSYDEQEEQAIGRVVAARVLATYPLLDDEALQRYVNNVGQTVAAYSERPSLDWHFLVLDSDVVNAFAAPGGYIFITTGALEQMSSEAELAAVIGHEIAHVNEKHVLQAVKRGNVFSATLDFASDEIANAGITDDMGEKIGQIAFDKLFTSGFSRGDELEADKSGVALAAAAGYRSDSYLTFLSSLDVLAGSNSSAFRQLGSTHPRPADRKKAVESTVSDRGVTLEERWKSTGR